MNITSGVDVAKPVDEILLCRTVARPWRDLRSGGEAKGVVAPALQLAGPLG